MQAQVYVLQRTQLELESFSQMSGIIQSGINNIQTILVLECEFTQTPIKQHIVPGGVEYQPNSELMSNMIR